MKNLVIGIVVLAVAAYAAKLGWEKYGLTVLEDHARGRVTIVLDNATGDSEDTAYRAFHGAAMASTQAAQRAADHWAVFRRDAGLAGDPPSITTVEADPVEDGAIVTLSSGVRIWVPRNDEMSIAP